MERLAFDRLITEKLPFIERATKSYATRYDIRHEWRDIAQTALLKMLRFADLYDPDKEFMTWASVVIINTIKTRIIQIYNTPDFSDLSSVFIDLTQATDNPVSDLETNTIFDNLNRETRLYVEGYNFKEIATLCGFRSKVTAMNRINNCANHLQRVLGIDAIRVKRTNVYVKSPA